MNTQWFYFFSITGFSETIFCHLMITLEYRIASQSRLLILKSILAKSNSRFDYLFISHIFTFPVLGTGIPLLWVLGLERMESLLHSFFFLLLLHPLLIPGFVTLEEGRYGKGASILADWNCWGLLFLRCPDSAS